MDESCPLSDFDTSPLLIPVSSGTSIGEQLQLNQGIGRGIECDAREASNRRRWKKRKARRTLLMSSAVNHWRKRR